MKLEQKHMAIIHEALGTYGEGIVQGIVELERRAVTAEMQLGQERNKNVELSKKLAVYENAAETAVEPCKECTCGPHCDEKTCDVETQAEPAEIPTSKPRTRKQ